MDQHPIPQDVTGFQFKLIGSMTVKQFGYIAVGVIAAVILYYFPLHFALAFLVKTLLIPLFGGSGFILAFVPIDGRPVDVMAGNFMKAFLSPNQYVYHKVGYTFSFSNITTAKAQTTAAETEKKTGTPQSREMSKKELQLQTYLQSSQKQIRNSLDEKEFALLKTITTTANHVTPTAAVARPVLLPTQAHPIPQPIIQSATLPVIPTVHTYAAPSIQSLPAGVTVPQKTPTSTPPPIEQQLTTPHTLQATAAVHEKASTLEQQLQQIHAEKQRLEDEIIRLKQQQPIQTIVQTPMQPAPSAPIIAQPVKPAATPSAQQPSQPLQQSKVIPLPTPKNTMVPHIPDTPNILVGLVKDSRGNALPHILVEVKDKDGNPVRAFKTNPLGQFASATPLTTGIYTIELEDPKRLNTFDAIQVISNNKIILPLEIISHDAREQLRRELFN